MTGELDMRSHYDHINAVQERIIRDPLEQLVKLLQLNKLGQVDEALTFEFVPLSDEDERQCVLLEQLREAKAFVRLLAFGVLRPSVADFSKVLGAGAKSPRYLAARDSCGRKIFRPVNLYSDVFEKGKPLEIDGYNDDLKLGFEYRGKQHYNGLYKGRQTDVYLKSGKKCVTS